MPITSKIHVIRQVMSKLCKGPGFDTVWSKVLSNVRCILGANRITKCLTVL